MVAHWISVLLNDVLQRLRVRVLSSSLFCLICPSCSLCWLPTTLTHLLRLPFEGYIFFSYLAACSHPYLNLNNALFLKLY
jgi:hypothetical protein